MSSARSEEGLIDGLAYSEDGILPDEISKIRPAFITSMETLRRLLRQDPISREDWMNGYRYGPIKKSFLKYVIELSGNGCAAPRCRT